MPKADLVPTIKCPCGAVVEIPGRRIGDSVECPACRKGQVILRSKVLGGEVPPADGAPGQISDRLPEVQESLERIRLRRASHAARGVTLYPPAAVFGAGVLFGFYLSAILAGQNLAALGQPARGRRLQAIGVVLYAVMIGALVYLVGRVEEGPVVNIAGKLGLPVHFILSGVFARFGRRDALAALEAGAKPVAPILPSIIGLLLAVAQFFAIFFVVASWQR